MIAVQHGKQIFNLAASFQAPEDGFEHQAPMPASPDPETLPNETELQKQVMADIPEAMRKWAERPRPIEMRPVDGGFFYMGKNPPPRDPENQVWFRARDPIGDDVRMQQVILAYASDMSLLSVAMRPHGVHWQTRGLQSASLDHAMWFHKPVNFNDWHLYQQDSPSASGGRGFIRGSIYSRDGVLVASVAQEGLIRIEPPGRADQALLHEAVHDRKEVGVDDADPAQHLGLTPRIGRLQGRPVEGSIDVMGDREGLVEEHLAVLEDGHLAERMQPQMFVRSEDQRDQIEAHTLLLGRLHGRPEIGAVRHRVESDRRHARAPAGRIAAARPGGDLVLDQSRRRLRVRDPPRRR